MWQNWSRYVSVLLCSMLFCFGVFRLPSLWLQYFLWHTCRRRSCATTLLVCISLGAATEFICTRLTWGSSIRLPVVQFSRFPALRSPIAVSFSPFSTQLCGLFFVPDPHTAPCWPLLFACRNFSAVSISGHDIATLSSPSGFVRGNLLPPPLYLLHFPHCYWLFIFHLVYCGSGLAVCLSEATRNKNKKKKKSGDNTQIRIQRYIKRYRYNGREVEKIALMIRGTWHLPAFIKNASIKGNQCQQWTTTDSSCQRQAAMMMRTMGITSVRIEMVMRMWLRMWIIQWQCHGRGQVDGRAD